MPIIDIRTWIIAKFKQELLRKKTVKEVGEDRQDVKIKNRHSESQVKGKYEHQIISISSWENVFPTNIQGGTITTWFYSILDSDILVRVVILLLHANTEPFSEKNQNKKLGTLLQGETSSFFAPNMIIPEVDVLLANEVAV